MDIKERISQYPNRRKITRKDTNENFVADIETDDAIEGNIGQVGTVITADLLNDIADKSIGAYQSEQFSNLQEQIYPLGA